MRYLCRGCSAVFDVPHGAAAECPFCGGADTAPAMPCANPRDNAGETQEGQRLCSRCRRELLGRAQTFFLSLSDAEAEQLDEWLDGSSVQDCRAWR